MTSTCMCICLCVCMCVCVCVCVCVYMGVYQLKHLMIHLLLRHSCDNQPSTCFLYWIMWIMSRIQTASKHINASVDRPHPLPLSTFGPYWPSQLLAACMCMSEVPHHTLYCMSQDHWDQQSLVVQSDLIPRMVWDLCNMCTWTTHMQEVSQIHNRVAKLSELYNYYHSIFNKSM